MKEVLLLASLTGSVLFNNPGIVAGLLSGGGAPSLPSFNRPQDYSSQVENVRRQIRQMPCP